MKQACYPSGEVEVMGMTMLTSGATTALSCHQTASQENQIMAATCRVLRSVSRIGCQRLEYLLLATLLEVAVDLFSGIIDPKAISTEERNGGVAGNGNGDFKSSSLYCLGPKKIPTFKNLIRDNCTRRAYILNKSIYIHAVCTATYPLTSMCSSS